MFGRPLLHRRAAELAAEIDAAADRDWLAAHPEAKERRRLPSVREVLAWGLPAGTIVIVRRLPEGAQARHFIPPFAQE
jgi:hypothetical protein